MSCDGEVQRLVIELFSETPKTAENFRSLCTGGQSPTKPAFDDSDRFTHPNWEQATKEQEKRPGRRSPTRAVHSIGTVNDFAAFNQSIHCPG